VKLLLGTLLAGVVIGVLGLLSFNGIMAATNTDAFCTSCHEMQGPYQELQHTAHFVNGSGVAAGCADCHVPKEFVPKMIRKIEASREVWGHFTGLIDTPEKYAAHREAMRERELKRLRVADSRECRDCHSVAQMDFTIQDRAVRRYHRAMEQRGKTCIDCHAGLAHPTATDLSQASASR
jgi:cytochrome c-type protein NapC